MSLDDSFDLAFGEVFEEEQQAKAQLSGTYAELDAYARLQEGQAGQDVSQAPAGNPSDDPLNPAPTSVEPEEESAGVLGTIGDATFQLGAGAVQGLVNTAQTVLDLGGLIDGPDITPDEPIGGEPQSAVGALTRGIGQFLPTFIPAVRGLKVLSASSRALKGLQAIGKSDVATGMVAGAFTDYAAFDPHEQRFSDLAISLGGIGDNPITRLLQADPDDSEAMGRFKNLVEGVMLGGAAEGLIKSARYMKGMREVNAGVALDDAAPVEPIMAGVKGAADQLVLARLNYADLEELTGSLRYESGVSSGIDEAISTLRNGRPAGGISPEAQAWLDRADASVGPGRERAALLEAHDRGVGAEDSAEDAVGFLDSQRAQQVEQNASIIHGLENETPAVAEAMDKLRNGADMKSLIEEGEKALNVAEEAWLAVRMNPEWDRLRAQDRDAIEQLIGANGPEDLDPRSWDTIARVRAYDESNDEVLLQARAMAEEEAEAFRTTSDLFDDHLKMTPQQDMELRRIALEGSPEDLDLWMAQNKTNIDVNLKNIEDHESFVHLLDRMTTMFSDSPNSLRSGAQSNNLTRDKANRLVAKMEVHGADMLDTPTEKFKAFVEGYKSSIEDLAAKHTAVRFMSIAMANRVAKLADTVNRGGATTRIYNDFLQSVRQMAAFNDVMAGGTTEIARALQAHKIVAVPAELRLFDAISNVHGAGGEEQIRKLAAKLAGARHNPKALNRMMRKATRGQMGWDIASEYWINSILSGPITQTVNLLSNAAVGMWLPTEQMATAVVFRDGALWKQSLAEFRGLTRGFQAALRMSAGAGQVLRDSAGEVFHGRPSKAKAILEQNRDKFGTVYESMATGRPVRDTTTKLEQIEPALSSASLGLQAGTTGAMLADAVGTVVRMPGRMLTAGDELSKTINYQMKLEGLAFRQAQDAGLHGKALDDHVKLIVDQAARWDEIPAQTQRALRSSLRKLHQDALGYAQRATFTEPLEKGTLSRWIQAGVNAHPTMRFVAPFVRTPTNIMKFFGQRTPIIAQFSNEWRRTMAHGTPAQKQAAMGRMMTGSVLWSTAALAAGEGKLTGAGPKNFEERQTMMNLTGWQPYSFAIDQPDGTIKYVSFNRSDPFGIFLGMAADFVEISGEAEEEELGELAGMMGAALAQNLKSKSYFQGITNIVDAVTDPNRNMESYMRRMAASFVPNVINQMNRTQHDSAIREIESVMDAIQARTPFSDGLVPRRNVFGEVVTFPMGLGWKTVSPFFTRDGNADKIGVEVVKQGVVTSLQKWYGKIGPTELDAATRDEYIRLAASDLSRNGMTLKKRLEGLFSSDYYQSLGDAVGENTGGKGGAILQVMSRHRSAAKRVMLQRHPELLEAMETERLERNLRQTQTGVEQLLSMGQ